VMGSRIEDLIKNRHRSRCELKRVCEPKMQRKAKAANPSGSEGFWFGIERVEIPNCLR